MCGRFTLHHKIEDITERFAVQQVLTPLEARYNVAPSQQVAIIRQKDERFLDAYKWGLVPFWAKDPSVGNRLINARAETLADKPAWRRALTHRRCLVPADGFYEWQNAGGAKPASGRAPFHIRMRDGSLFAFAGLWDAWRHGEGEEPLRTCTLVTTTPNQVVEPLHNRMPVVLRQEDEALWLDRSVQDIPLLLSLLQPYPPGRMEAYEVARLVNAPAFEDAACMQPVDEQVRTAQDDLVLPGLG